MRWKRNIAGLLGIVLIASSNMAWAEFRGDIDPSQRTGPSRTAARAERQPVPQLENRQNSSSEPRHHDGKKIESNTNVPPAQNPNHYERKPLNYPPNWHPPGPPPQDWHPHNPPPPNWHPYPPPPGFPPGHYPPKYYPGYVQPVLIAPYPNYTVGEVVAGVLIVGMVVKAISAASDPVVVNNKTYYYDGDNYYEPVMNGMDTAYQVAANPYDH